MWIGRRLTTCGLFVWGWLDKPLTSVCNSCADKRAKRKRAFDRLRDFTYTFLHTKKYPHITLLVMNVRCVSS